MTCQVLTCDQSQPVIYFNVSFLTNDMPGCIIWPITACHVYVVPFSTNHTLYCVLVLANHRPSLASASLTLFPSIILHCSSVSVPWQLPVKILMSSKAMSPAAPLSIKASNTTCCHKGDIGQTFQEAMCTECSFSPQNQQCYSSLSVNNRATSWTKTRTRSI